MLLSSRILHSTLLWDILNKKERSAPAVYSFTTKCVTLVRLKIIAAPMVTINAIAGINYCVGSLLDIFITDR